MAEDTVDQDSLDLRSVLARGDRNLASYLRHLSVTATDGSHQDDGGVLCFAGGHPYPGTYTNGVIRTDDTTPAADALETARAYFQPLRRGYAVWVKTHHDADLAAAAAAAGMWQRPPLSGNPGIVWTGGRLGVPRLPGVEIRRAEDQAARAEYLDVVLEGYGIAGLPADLAERVIFSTRSLDDERVRAFVAYDEADRSRGLSVAMVYVEGDTAGIQWGATRLAARGRGLGKAVFRAAHDAAIGMGATCVAGQASQQGLPLWTSLGYRTVTHYQRFLAKPPS